MDRMIKKFIILTRGRTGSTAVVDELSKSLSLCVMQELFLKYDFEKSTGARYMYKLLLPFDLWKLKGWWWRWLSPIKYCDGLRARRYLEEAERIASQQGKAGFGFKVLSHHFKQRPFLSALLKRQGYRVIYLTRNVGRQVLSGMVAKKRGIYNAPGSFEDSNQYHIDLDEFEDRVRGARQAVEKDYARLTAEGFKFIVVTYEDFTTNRQSFFEQVYQFLGFSVELPPKSHFAVMIKNLRHTIENYDHLVERANAMGITLEP